jgi:hypothetical protein
MKLPRSKKLLLNLGCTRRLTILRSLSMYIDRAAVAGVSSEPAVLVFQQ